jgi:hypothetical protein
MTVKDIEGRTIYLSRVPPSASTLRAAAVVPVLKCQPLKLSPTLTARNATVARDAAVSSPPSTPAITTGVEIDTIVQDTREGSVHDVPRRTKPDILYHGHGALDSGSSDDNARDSLIARPPPSPDASISYGDAAGAAATTATTKATAYVSGTCNEAVGVHAAHGRASDIFTDKMERMMGECGESSQKRVAIPADNMVVLSTSVSGDGGAGGGGMPSDDELLRALSGVAPP